MKYFILLAALLAQPLCAQNKNKGQEKSIEPDQRSQVLGYWYMYDLSGKEPTGIVYFYEYEGKVYGRTIVTIDPDTKEVQTYNKPVSRVPHIEGNPWFQGLDILWNLTWDAKKRKYIKGKVLDPRRKNPYNAEIWRDGENLKMFGAIGPFGLAVTWRPATAADLPPGCPPIRGPLTPKIYFPVKN